MHLYEPVAINHHFDKDAFSMPMPCATDTQEFKKHFNPTQLAVIAALVLGQQQDISAEILHDYQLRARSTSFRFRVCMLGLSCCS
jgi:hypothetical protein